jgi:hypothetical protein
MVSLYYVQFVSAYLLSIFIYSNTVCTVETTTKLTEFREPHKSIADFLVS